MKVDEELAKGMSSSSGPSGKIVESPARTMLEDRAYRERIRCLGQAGSEKRPPKKCTDL